MSEEITASSIKFVPTEALIKELFSRFDCVLFVGNQMKAKDNASLGWHAQGDYFSLVGLTQWISNQVDKMEPRDPHESESGE